MSLEDKTTDLFKEGTKEKSKTRKLRVTGPRQIEACETRHMS
jgi:hypothetical protein